VFVCVCCEEASTKREREREFFFKICACPRFLSTDFCPRFTHSGSSSSSSSSSISKTSSRWRCGVCEAKGQKRERRRERREEKKKIEFSFHVLPSS